jgi:hypothetical protein
MMRTGLVSRLYKLQEQAMPSTTVHSAYGTLKTASKGAHAVSSRADSCAGTAIRVREDDGLRSRSVQYLYELIRIKRAELAISATVSAQSRQSGHISAYPTASMRGLQTWQL